MPRKPKSPPRASRPATPGRRRSQQAIPAAPRSRPAKPSAKKRKPSPPKPPPKPVKRPRPKAKVPPKAKPKKPSPKKPAPKKPAPKPSPKKPAPKKRKPSAPRSRPQSIAEGFAQFRQMQAAMAVLKTETAERIRLLEKENKRLSDEAEALRSRPKVPVLEGDELPEGFKPIEEERPAAPKELVHRRANEITTYLGTIAACLRLANISVRVRATFIARDNQRAEGEILVNIPRGMTHSELTYGEVGECIQKFGSLPGTWITLGWYFAIPPEEHGRYLRYRGGYAAFARAQHANTVNVMSENLITASRLADSYQKEHRGRKPIALIFRLLWTVKKSPYEVSAGVWDRNGGQPPKD